MSIINSNWSITTGEHGLAVIERTGRCTSDERTDIESNCTRRYELVGIPQASGAILKSMDGSRPLLVEVTPGTFSGQVYRCVKVDGRCSPFSYVQTDGPYAGKAVHRFRIVYQQVGGVA
jgi:hypothetical protein